MSRQSPIAGTWYEGTKQQLTNQIQSLLKDDKFGPGKDPTENPAIKSVDESILGIVSPHAGYVYSGSIAAHGFSKLYENFPNPDTIVIIGPNHRGYGPPVSIYPEGIWKFPLGDISIDKELVDYAKNWDFGSFSDYVQIEESAHLQEHSIDIQIPFLQYFYGDKINIFSICLADQSLNPVAEVLSSFLKEMIDVFRNKKILIVASTDFSHENDYDLLVNNDQTMIDLLERLNLEEADQFRKSNRMTMCGYGSVYTLIRLAQKMGDPSVKTLKYSNSALVKDSKGGYTVGYCSMVVRVKTR